METQISVGPLIQADYAIHRLPWLSNFKLRAASIETVGSEGKFYKFFDNLRWHGQVTLTPPNSNHQEWSKTWINSQVIRLNYFHLQISLIKIFDPLIQGVSSNISKSTFKKMWGLSGLGNRKQFMKGSH